MRKSSKSIGAGGGATRACRRNRGVEQAHEEQSKIMKRRSRERRSMMRSMRTGGAESQESRAEIAEQNKLDHKRKHEKDKDNGCKKEDCIEVFVKRLR